MTSRLSGVVALVFIGATGSPAGTYTFWNFDYPNAGATVAYGVNNNGQIVGSYGASIGDTPNGFYYDGSDFFTINKPGAVATHPHGINDNVHIVGSYVDIAGHDIGFRYNLTTFQDFSPSPIPSETYPQGIDNHDRIAGYYQLGLRPFTDTPRGFYFDGTANHDLFDTADIAHHGTFVNGLNDNALFAGSYLDIHGITQGFLSDGVLYNNFGIPGSVYAEASGINDSGLLVGYSLVASPYGFIAHGFTYLNGTFSSFDDPGGTQTWPWGVNNSGQIVGYYLDATGLMHGFLATPVTASAAPEPSTMALLGAALIACGFRIRRQTNQ